MALLKNLVLVVVFTLVIGDEHNHIVSITYMIQMTDIIDNKNNRNDDFFGVKMHLTWAFISVHALSID